MQKVKGACLKSIKLDEELNRRRTNSSHLIKHILPGLYIDFVNVCVFPLCVVCTSPQLAVEPSPSPASPGWVYPIPPPGRWGGGPEEAWYDQTLSTPRNARTHRKTFNVPSCPSATAHIIKHCNENRALKASVTSEFYLWKIISHTSDPGSISWAWRSSDKTICCVVSSNMDEGKCMTQRKSTELYFSLTNLRPEATTHAAHGVNLLHLRFVELFLTSSSL